MKSSRLTGPMAAATSRLMEDWGSISDRDSLGASFAKAMLVAGVIALPGCISVNAPDKPIVIELNINIKQEVIYRLAADAENTIEENEDIF